MTKRKPQTTAKTSPAQKLPTLWITLGVAAVLILAVIGWMLNRNANIAPAAAGTMPAEISVEEAYKLYQDGVFLLDVRNQDEWDDFHAPNATLIPLGELKSRLSEVPQDQSVVVICNSGNRSKTARDFLLESGLKDVTSVNGGMQAWRQAGYPAAGAMPAEISVEEAYKLYQDGVFLLDVRNQDEWDDFHAPNATLIPLGELKSRFSEVPPDQPVVVICNSGNRSKTARDFLLESGLKDVTSVTGGMQAWRQAGYPVE